MKFWLRKIGGIYRLLAKQGGAYCNLAFLDDFRAIKKVEQDLRQGS